MLSARLGSRFSRQHALLHSEGYSDFAIADAARQLFWERIQTLAANHGIFRVWTQERSPFWKSFGFQPPTAEILARLPDEWKNEFDGGWLTLQLKNEEAITAALEKQFAPFMAGEKSETKKISEKAKTINTHHHHRRLCDWNFWNRLCNLSFHPPQSVFKMICSSRRESRSFSSEETEPTHVGCYSSRCHRQGKFIRVIRTAHHRPARDVDKTHFFRTHFVFRKFLRRHKFHHRQMFQRRLQILAEREDVAA